jgi:hypothetical protein
MATAIAILAILVFGGGALMVRIGVFRALAELWRTTRRK